MSQGLKYLLAGPVWALKWKFGNKSPIFKDKELGVKIEYSRVIEVWRNLVT
jgi:hypothetical protein